MILEQAVLYIKPETSVSFEKDFIEAKKSIVSIEGFIKLDLLRCIEEQDKYLLLVTWDSVASHEIGFRKSIAYQEWKRLLHHYYEPFPIVQHYAPIML